METIRKCCKCNMQSFLFTYFFSLDFDLNSPFLQKKPNNEIDLIDLFNTQNNISINLTNLKKIQCINCHAEMEHKESKIFYLLPYQLVLYFNRGNDNENKMKIKYQEKLDLSKTVKDEKFSPKLFELKGIIKRSDINGKEHYFSLVFNDSDKFWYFWDNEKSQKINSLEESQDGDIVMLFYVSNK